MKRYIASVLSCAVCAMAAETNRFEDSKMGEMPSGWEVAITGAGQPEWRIDRDATAPSVPNVLKQSGETPKPSFPLCLKEGSSLKDGFVQVSFKPVSGKIDQAAGVVWRAKDKDNYYICRANALENNVVLYQVQNGKRTSLEIVGRKGGYGVDVPVKANQWQTLRVEFAGTRAKVMLDGKPLFEVEDSTFTEAGRVGLWTKADSVTLFDDFTFGEVEQR